MADQTIPRYGTVEAYVRILRRLNPEYLESSALAVVQMLVDHPDDSDARKVELVKNLLAAVEQVRSHLADPTGLTYSRADEADDPTPVSGGRVEPHVGAMTDAGLVEVESEPPVQHSHAGGSFGGPGENSAECACGVTYDGFDTPAEANLRLAMHIDSANSPES